MGAEVTTAELKTIGVKDANGAIMKCEVTLSMGRCEPEYLACARIALDQAYRYMKVTLKGFGDETK